MANGKNMSIDVNRCEMKTVCELVFDLLGRSVERLLSHTHTHKAYNTAFCAIWRRFFLILTGVASRFDATRYEMKGKLIEIVWYQKYRLCM